MWQRLIVFAVLAITIAFLIWGRWRYDLISVIALLALALTGILPPGQVFEGFASPAVITIASVMVVSRALWNAGIIDAVSHLITRYVKRPRFQFMALTGLLSLCSTVISDVGALAVFLPIAVQVSKRQERPLGPVLMPLAFSAILGGIVTLTGTTPNILISSYRARVTGHPFGFFAFTPVGGVVALAGLLFLWALSTILLPRRLRKSKPDEPDGMLYLTEIVVPPESPFVDRALGELHEEIDLDFAIAGVIRDEVRKPANRYLRLRAGDILFIQAAPEDLKSFLDVSKMNLSENKDVAEKFQLSDEMGLKQVILRPESSLVGSSAQSLNLRRRYGINLLAISRQGSRVTGRLGATVLQAGDVLLLHGDQQVLAEVISRFRLVPLASEAMRLVKPTRILSALLIFAAAVAAVVLGLAPVDVSFVAAAVLMVLTGHLSLRELYDSLELPILVLLGAFISIGVAFQRTGDAAWMAHLVLALGRNWPIAAIVGLLMVLTLGFSNFMNNAATAVIFAPIAISIAQGLRISPDPLLMTVALGSCLPFLTPVGHQCNALVLSPGGYRFGDYWKVGLPLSVFLILVSVPMILWVWPARA